MDHQKYYGSSANGDVFARKNNKQPRKNHTEEVENTWNKNEMKSTS